MTELPWQDGDYPGARATAARVRRFVRITGLKPSRAIVPVFWVDPYGPRFLPDGADHTLVWSSGARHVMTTEPYRSSGGCEALEGWCDLHGWGYLALPGLGMWNPPRTVLYLLYPPQRPPGAVDSLTLGMATVAVRPGDRVVRQGTFTGAHEVKA